MNIENNKKIELFFFAAASLYLELAVIRFTAAEVLYLGYFSNFILISAFVGLGLGFLSIHKNIALDKCIPFALLFLFALVLSSKFDVSMLRNHFGLFFFGNVLSRTGLPGSFLLITLFITTVMLFAGIGNRIANSFQRFKPLTAYALDISGSLVGIILFTVQSILASGPITWVITAGLLLFIGYLSSEKEDALSRALVISVTCLAIVVLLLSNRPGFFTIWSTYQKLVVQEVPQNNLKVVYANGILHQFLHPLTSTENTYYEAPYKLHKAKGGDLDNVLIIGAGSGTDTAVALHHGAMAIDAVEIDKRIVQIGEQFHPDQPYSDPRVNKVIEDGRQYLRNTDKKYDLIVFALPDSLIRMSAMSSVRLESYLFTLESFAEAKEHLKPGGTFVMYNQYRWQWLINKLATAIESTFGQSPLIKVYDDTTVIAIGENLGGTSYASEGFTRLASDDWPFIYMQKPGIHWLYIGMISLFLMASLAGVFFLAPKGTLLKPNFPFFFMGMAFLLLETKSLAFFSLLFGTTWLVNSLAFAGILVSVLIANYVVQKTDIRNKQYLYVGLFVFLLIAYIIPTSTFLNIESLTLRYFAAVVLAFSPIFFANLVFSREFKDSKESTQAFGWNLLGAVAGGGLEYFSLLIGFRNLLWIVAICYMVVALMSLKGRRLIA